MENNLPAVQGTWGAETTSTKDLVIPKVQIAQASSSAVKEGVARPGELINMQTGEVLAKKGEKLELLPILCIGSWNVSKVVGGNRPNEFVRKIPLTPENDSDVWKQADYENGEPVERQKCLSFLVLLVSRSQGFPFMIDFQKSNKNGGKLLSTVMQENMFLGKPAPARVVELSVGMRSYQNNSWFVYGIAPQRDATPEELLACKKWYDLFSSRPVIAADESDDGLS